MEVNFRKMNYKNADFELLEKWYNGPIYKKQYDWCPSSEDQGRVKTLESIKKTIMKDRKIITRYFIEEHGNPIGEIYWGRNPKQLFRSGEDRALIHIGILEDIKGRDRKVYKQTLQYFEELLKEETVLFLETGIFEYDYTRLTIFKEIGFREIGRIAKWTYNKGKMWGDIRLQKEI